MTQMTIQKALTKLKTLKDRLLEKPGPVLSISQYDKPLSVSFDNLKDMESKLKANFQSQQELLTNYTSIKLAIDKSNTVTTIMVAGNSYTVAEALNYKNNVIPVNIQYLTRLKSQVELIQRQYTLKTDSTEFDKIEDKDLVDALLPKICDPNKISEYIQKEEKKIQDFLDEIDDALVSSNVATMIEV